MSTTDYVLGAGWLLGWLLLFRVPRLPPRAGDAAWTAATVVIPARNEAANLPRLLGDLAGARPPNVRVVVVDDGSEDDTAAVAASYDFVEVLRAPAPEPGWVGKSWACHLGAERAREGALVFVDADVRLRPDALARVLDVQARGGGLVTVWPRHEPERLYEHLSALPTLVTAMSVGLGSPLRSRSGLGLGPVMATSLADYRAVGGHASVRGDVTDDLALARRFADAGLPVTNFGGGAEVGFRMYPQGLRGLAEGWTKCLGRGLAWASSWRAIGITVWLTFAVGALFWAHGLPRPLSFVFWGLFASQIGVQLRQVGTFGWLDAVLYPLHLVALVLLLVASLWMTLVRREVRWRGRRVPIRARPREPSP